MGRTTQRRNYLGNFTLPNGGMAPGELRLRKSRTNLRLKLAKESPAYPGLATITGLTDDLVKVTCLDCLIGWSAGGWKREGDVHRVYHHYDIFPHYVAVGDRHLDPAARSIEELSFRVDDAELLFPDFGAFGHVFDAESVIDSVVAASRLSFKPEMGDHPMVAFFTGRMELVAVDTDIGRLSVHYRPRWSTGSARGVYIKGGMTVALRPPGAMTFEECLERLVVVRRFLSLLAGRTQGVRDVRLRVGDEKDDNNRLELKFSYPIRGEKRLGKNSSNRPHPGDIPLSLASRKREFETVLRDWIKREPGWRQARVRYADCLAKGDRYGTNRLIAAANMFDILPENALPPIGQVEPRLQAAKDAAKAIFRNLPESSDRNSVLDAIGRAGKPSLPKRVAHRTAIVEAQLGHKLPNLQLVAKTAVRLRNYFVHGSSDGLNIDALEPLLSFLTDVLELIFAASDLIDAGWDAKAWSEGHYGSGHSFARLRWGYEPELHKLKSALGIAA